MPIGTLLLYRLAIPAVTLIFSFLAVSKRNRGWAPIMTVISLILLFREMMGALFPNDLIYQISEFSILVLYFFWLRDESRFRGLYTWLLSFNFLVAVVVVADVWHPPIFTVVYGLFRYSFLLNYLLFSCLLFIDKPRNPYSPLPYLRWAWIPIAGALYTGLLYGPMSGDGRLEVTAFLLNGLHLLLIYSIKFFEDQRTAAQIESQELEQRAVLNLSRNLRESVEGDAGIDQFLNESLELIVHSAAAAGGVAYIVDELNEKMIKRAWLGIFRLPREKVGKRGEAESIPPELIDLDLPLLGEAGRKGRTIHRRQHGTDVIITPLLIDKKILGVLAFSRSAKKETERFNLWQYRHCVALAEHVAVGLDTLMLSELLIESREHSREAWLARDIQKKILPDTFPAGANFSMAGYSTPASGISGDFYDIIPIGKDRYAVAIGSVARKGIPATVIMVMIHTILQLIAGSKRSVEKILAWVNRGIIGKILKDNFATLFYMVVDAKSRSLVYANAGHRPMLLLRRSESKIEQHTHSGLPIGIQIDSAYEAQEIACGRGDIFILYTEGFIEARNSSGELYGIERLKKMLKSYHDTNPQDLSVLIQNNMKLFTGMTRQHDDQTVLVGKFR